MPFVTLASLPLVAWGSVNVTLTWVPSPDPNVSGYNIYFGGASQAYTNVISAGNVSGITVSGLIDGATYYFAAKAYDAAGDESDFSNEAAFTGITVTPSSTMRLTTIPTNVVSDQITYSLAAGAPAGATINPTNGIFSWNPGHAYASTTNSVTVVVTDNSNPNLSLTETVQIVVTDYLELGLGSVAVQAGRLGSLPIIVAANQSVNSLQFTLNWPTNNLRLNPMLTFAPPVVAGSIQNQATNLLVELQLASGQNFTTATALAQINFQAAPNQPSAILGVQAANAVGTKSDASAFNNVLSQPGQVVVVGNNPLLQPQASPAQERTLTLFANPGVNYELQSTTNLAPPVVWTPQLDYQQTNVSQTMNLGSADPVIFYRLQQL